MLKLRIAAVLVAFAAVLGNGSILITMRTVTTKSVSEHRAIFLSHLSEAMASFGLDSLSFSFASNSESIVGTGEDYCMCPSLNMHASGCAFSCAPTEGPSKSPTKAPTTTPTPMPTHCPTFVPTYAPTSMPTTAPTPVPTENPTISPTSKELCPCVVDESSEPPSEWRLNKVVIGANKYVHAPITTGDDHVFGWDATEEKNGDARSWVEQMGEQMGCKVYR
jgi:hypothetical protein